MLLLKPDPTFYPSAKLAMQAPAEGLAYVATLQRHGKPDALRVVDLDANSPTYGQFVHTLELPYVGDELHHFGWNACSSALCPYAPHPYLERRYLVIPGLRSSRLYIVDTKPNPREPRLVKIIEPEEVKTRAGYSRPHTVHCGPSGIYISALGGPNGGGPGGVFVLDHYDFEILGRWEVERGPQFLGYDFWWHLGQDVAITSEWGPPELFENGLNLADVVNRRFGHCIHMWDLRRRTHLQQLDLGDENQMVLELRPAHDPTRTYGFVGVVVNLQNLSSAIWLWYKEGEKWAIRKVIEVPAEPADPSVLPPMLKDLGVVPPLVTDINLSLDDRFLYVSCWGTGELRQYDVSDPFNAKLTGSVRIGGLVNPTPHPTGGAVQGGPQMVEVSRDGRRIYFTNSLYSSWDDQFYPDMRGWMVRVDANPTGGMAFDADFFVDFGEMRAHQVRLQGGDSSSDSFCYP